MILGAAQLSDTDRIAQKHLGRNIRWMVTGTHYDDFGARNLSVLAFETAGGFRNSAITGTSKPISKRAFGLRE